MATGPGVRRVITTVDKNDKAVVLIDDISPHRKTRPSSQTTSHLVWVTDQTPADLAGTKDRAAIEVGIQPPRGGSICRVVEFPPETEEMRKLGVDQKSEYDQDTPEHRRFMLARYRAVARG